MIVGGNWWRANEIVIRHLTRQTKARHRSRDKAAITYVGLDVHKDTIAVALAEAGVRGDVREYGKVANTPTALKALARKLERPGNALRFCYEAGPCGYGIQRQL